MEPEWLERCVEILDRHPEVQLAFPRTLRIDETGAITGRYPDYGGMRLMSSRPSQLFGDIISKQHNCVAVFGLAETGSPERIFELGSQGVTDGLVGHQPLPEDHLPRVAFAPGLPGVIARSSLPERERRACRRQLVRWVIGPRWYRQRWVKLLRDAFLGGYRHGRRILGNRQGT